MTERIKTGVKGLDDMMEGGLIKNTINMITGEAGTGKSTMAIQYLMSGIMQGKPGIYLCTEEKKEKVLDNMMRFGWDLKKMEEERKFKFYDLRPQELQTWMDQGITGLVNEIRNLRAERVVVDSITTYSLLYEKESDVKANLKKLFEHMDRWNTTIIITSEMQDRYSKYNIEYLIDGIIMLYNERKDYNRTRSIEIYKMRGTKHETRTVPFMIGDKGIEVHKDMRLQ